ncbi:hypothetical protein ABK040_014417 [Willaertia magna]
MSDNEDDDYLEEEQEDNNEEIENSEEEEIEDEEEVEDLEEEESLDDIPNFEDGLTPKLRMQVKNARKSYFDEKNKEINASLSNEYTSKVKEKWNNLLSNPQVNSAFDFQVLKNLLEDTEEKSSHDKELNMFDKLDIKQKGDDWNYTIGLPKDEENGESSEELISDDESEEEED